jgi:hypothetical protein
MLVDKKTAKNAPTKFFLVGVGEVLREREKYA